MLGTDGLWDNLYTFKIIELIRPFIRGSDNLDDPELISEIISTEAERMSKEKGYLSPFAKNAHKYHYDYMGGKQDDITVMVA